MRISISANQQLPFITDRVIIILINLLYLINQASLTSTRDHVFELNVKALEEISKHVARVLVHLY